ncbi:HAD-IIIA family hydrolase [Luteipulveratus sp. YIM 133132]|uniref:D-glycero-alpha-D-manno-heptose-1,7-bisphosphate 7-phosphatase n=1 Tax=Luteipulveratus flavus TaxID=3031728 RepID=UPI0023AF5F97|nr:HAD-IIIA family hydrolase [Luteipulveratus sp. YIM 133132]MDE9364541.1 HAD-IIIA family hydrolase [Luteipulveratus sp. YIM 133132]
MTSTQERRRLLLGLDDAPIRPAEPSAPYDIVFLDRDGTLNRHRPGYVSRAQDLDVLAEAPAAVRRLNDAGCRVVLVTNQRGLATGALREDELASVHQGLVDALAGAGAWLDAIEVCPHDAGECGCRKPLPGMFRRALARAPWADAERCVMVGDQPSDLEPARLLGMRAEQVTGPARGIGEVVHSLLMTTI